MDNENKLLAPRAVKGYRTALAYKKGPAVQRTDRSLNVFISPQKKASCLDLKSNFDSKEKDEDLFDFEKEIIDAFDELSVKSEIFSILREGSTWCDSFEIRNSNPSGRIKENILGECVDSESHRKSSPLRINNDIYNNFEEDLQSELEGTVSEFQLYKVCKKLD